MIEGEAHRVQPLPMQAQPLGQDRIRTVEQVTHAGVPDRGHVDPDLMRPAGFQPNVGQAGAAERLDGVVMRHTGAAARHHGEPAVA